MVVDVVYARESIPAGGPAVMLLGPTPRSDTVPSWRPAAIDLLAERWHGAEPLFVLSPESRGGRRAKHYDDQVASELAMIQAATVQLFWIPRCLQTLPGFTTNVEAGMCFAEPGRMVLGCPPDCPDPIRNRYLIWHARRLGIPVCTTLSDVVDAALNRIDATVRC